MSEAVKAPQIKAPQPIAAGTGVGAVHVGVTDGEQARVFYRDVVGLTELPGDGGAIRMGAGGKELVVLQPGASGPVVQRRTGLYHLALLVPDRKELARVIARLMAIRYPNSPTDHLMTKSDYLWDPDGNGIEVYAESPEDGDWAFENGGFGAVTKDGRPHSGREPIDLEQLFGHLTQEDRLDAPMPDDAKMGHVHLHIADVDEALRFYHELIGFDVMGNSPSFGAAFVSAGGYHHHLGLNTWAGKGASPAPPGTAGLRHFTIEVPDGAELDRVKSRLEGGGAATIADGDGFYATDPSQNRVRVAVRR